MTVQFSYDGQIRKFVLQFIRLCSNFQVEFGQNATGGRTLQTVPVYYGDASRQAAMILRNNSENALNAVPAMAAYINGLTYDRERVLSPSFESTVNIPMQQYDQATQSYTGTKDKLYSVDRMMPVPYNLQVKLDIWTSNIEQKHQLLEQLLPLFNPALEIQNSDNYVDWGSLSAVFLKDVSYTNRTVPSGSDDSTIDITSLTFDMPIWLSLPAKVKKAGVVAEIITSLYAPEGGLNSDIQVALNGLVSQQRFTPLSYSILYMGNTLTLYQGPANNPDNDAEDEAESLEESYALGTKAKWNALVNLYGKLINGISQVRLRFDHTDGAHEIVGTVAYDPTDSHNLLFTPIAQTLPANTLPNVNAIIDPLNVNVENVSSTGQSLLSPAAGTRYLILNPIGSVNNETGIAWQGAAGTNLIARANDIIEWNGSYWHVSFDSRDIDIQYVTNMNTTVQYKWTGESWIKSYEGLYRAGEWNIVL